MNRAERLRNHLMALPPALYLLLFFAVPSVMMLFASFRYPGEYGGLAPWYYIEDGQLSLDFTLENWLRLFESGIYLGLLFKSLGYALLTTLICTIMAYPLALMIARSQKRFRDLLLLLVILPFWSNFLVRIYAWMIIFSPQGALTIGLNHVTGALGLEPISLMFSSTAVITCLVYVHLPFMILPLYANLEKHDNRLLDAAQDLGANRFQCFWLITWPQSLPGIYAGAILVFIPSLGIFAIPDLLGGTNGIMIGNVIKQQFVESRDWPFGSVLSLVLTGITLLLVLLAAKLGKTGGANSGT
ncbi:MULTISPECIES: ABC transporter permease [Zhongshania]|jgi:spermidine/putrescine transport system permease protein|uniref:Spermidine/putrescine transport system permease protein n=1 Tax=Zhongshania antarctica TaxID=641702 RepID=A0A840R718_9GAMM|nr:MULTISPECIES: ABC transporter permease [Zhongshania]MBB5188273.1 spermidine/putrescine transport system permease protein [Zhongshania antarctica]